MQKEDPNVLKEEGNRLFRENDLLGAIECFSKAIKLDPTNSVIFSNRAFTYIKLEKYSEAVEDANAALALNPHMLKAIYRRGCAFFALGKFKEAFLDFNRAKNLDKNDPDIKLRLEECKSELERIQFEQAIASANHSTVNLEKDINNLVVESTYHGPHLEAQITHNFVIQLMDWFSQQKNLHIKYAYQMLMKSQEILETNKSLVDITVPEDSTITVCGDVHGQYYDLMNIFKLNGYPSEKNMYLFNGDFVDRGSFSCECIFSLLAWKMLYPNHFFLARGNHESRSMNRMYGFEGEVVSKYSERAYEMFQDVFCALPLAHCINSKILVVHGGLFSKDGVTLDDIRAIERRREPPSEGGLMSDILWSDPQPYQGRGASKRGVGMSFGPDITHAFLDHNGLDLLIRSHEVKPNGYEIEADGRLITVFSAPNYCDQAGNQGAFIKYTSTLEPTYRSFDAVPHPNVPALRYADPFLNFY